MLARFVMIIANAIFVSFAHLTVTSLCGLPKLQLKSFLNMAKLEPMVVKSLEELESEITCPICQEHCTEPKVLPCLHYTARSASSSLPSRRSLASPSEGGVDNLKTAFFANRLTSKVKVEVKCELCTASSKAEAFCRQ